MPDDPLPAIEDASSRHWNDGNEVFQALPHRGGSKAAIDEPRVQSSESTGSLVARPRS